MTSIDDRDGMEIKKGSISMNEKKILRDEIIGKKKYGNNGERNKTIVSDGFNTSLLFVL